MSLSVDSAGLLILLRIHPSSIDLTVVISSLPHSLDPSLGLLFTRSLLSYYELWSCHILSLPLGFMKSIFVEMLEEDIRRKWRRETIIRNGGEFDEFWGVIEASSRFWWIRWFCRRLRIRRLASLTRDTRAGWHELVDLRIDLSCLVRLRMTD